MSGKGRHKVDSIINILDKHNLCVVPKDAFLIMLQESSQMMDKMEAFQKTNESIAVSLQTLLARMNERDSGMCSNCSITTTCDDVSSGDIPYDDVYVDDDTSRMSEKSDDIHQMNDPQLLHRENEEIHMKRARHRMRDENIATGDSILLQFSEFSDDRSLKRIKRIKRVQSFNSAKDDVDEETTEKVNETGDSKVQLNSGSSVDLNCSESVVSVASHGLVEDEDMRYSAGGVPFDGINTSERITHQLTTSFERFDFLSDVDDSAEL